MELINSLWIEKYRPKKIDDLVLDEVHRDTFSRFIEKKEIPHCLFTGPAGSGKSTVCKKLAKQLGWSFISTGTIYRALGVLTQEKKIALDDIPALESDAKELATRVSWDHQNSKLLLVA